jgi:putative spermidine/putrescine transport system substrate-binding protein
MTIDRVSRRTFLSGTAGALAAGTLAPQAQAQMAMPKSPIAINLVDVGGALALVQKPIENFRAAKPELVSRITFTKAPAPELPGKLKAQQDAGRVDIDFVLGGLDVISAGNEQKLWTDLLPKFAGILPKPESIYLKGALDMHALAMGGAMCMVYYPSGPLIEYAPEKVKTPPGSAEELLAWAKANPNKFLYARPANSGPGRTFLMGLPYILGDSAPKDPEKGWDKTWAYLKELGQYIEYYPTGTGVTMKELGDGTRDIIVSTTGWDINPRVLGIVPKSAEVARLKGFHWVSDAQYMAIPRGVADEKLPVLLELIKWVLQPDQQAFTYDEGYFYPGPAVKDVPLSMAPAASQAALKEYGRPQYEEWIGSAPIETPLDNDKMVLAFKRWDQEIGASKSK